MGFGDYTAKVQIDVDDREVWKWCDEHLEIGTWGKQYGLTGTSATYCFKNENDALLFLIRFPDK
jgi:hypothetical protein